jgi:hypothetical protein
VFLSSPASYLTLAQIKADETLDLTTRTGAAISDATLADWLEETSGEIDAIIGQSFLPREETVPCWGNGSEFLSVARSPLIYLRQVKIVLPNTVGFDVPTQSLLVDYDAGRLQNMTPLTYQGVGVTTLFPRGLRIDVTCGWGVNYAVPPPTFIATPHGGLGVTPLASGDHTVRVASMTYCGESLPSAPTTVTLGAPGAIDVTITNAPGALRYLIYVDGLCAAEIATISMGNGLLAVTVDASLPSSPACYTVAGARRTPATTDSSAAPLQGKYAALRAAQKKLVQSRAWEMKNKSNQGLSGQRSGDKEIRYRDNTRSTFNSQLDTLLAALKFQGC